MLKNDSKSQNNVRDFFGNAKSGGLEKWKNLTKFRPMSPFYTPWKHQKTFVFLVFSGGYKIGTLFWNGLSNCITLRLLVVYCFLPPLDSLLRTAVVFASFNSNRKQNYLQPLRFKKMKSSDISESFWIISVRILVLRVVLFMLRLFTSPIISSFPTLVNEQCDLKLFGALVC